MQIERLGAEHCQAGDWQCLGDSSKKEIVDRIIETVLDDMCACGRDPAGIEGRLIANAISDIISGKLDNAYSNACAASLIGQSAKLQSQRIAVHAIA